MKKRIGVPKEIKDLEFRVGATPSFVKTLIDAGLEVVVEKDAGYKIGFTDEMYKAAGAGIVNTAEEIYDSEMVIKVKEPQEKEYGFLKEGQVLFCYLHLAPDPEQTKALVDKKVVAIAYETVTDVAKRLPLLMPMSEIAGRIAVQAGAFGLQLINGGRGCLLGGVPGVLPAEVIVLGGGAVGTQAARMAMGLGADVTIFDTSLQRLKELDALYGPRLKTLYSSRANVAEKIKSADLVIGAVLIPGKTAPRLVTKEMVQSMKKGAVIVDVAIDQGGCVETARPTTHSDPYYIEHGVVHYCVTNMPGATARTSTEALTNATLPYALKLATLGWQKAMLEDRGLMEGLNVCLGNVTNSAVAEDLGYSFFPPEQFITSCQEEALI